MHLDKKHRNTKHTVLHISSGDLWGGAEAQVFLLFHALFESEHNNLINFRCLLFNEGLLAEKLNSLKNEVFIANEKKGVLSWLSQSFKYFKNNRANLIIAHGYKESFLAFLLSLYFRVPWVLQIHGRNESSKGFKNFKSFIYFNTQIFLAKFFSKKIIFVSNLLKSDLGFNNFNKSVVILNAAEKPVSKSDEKNAFIKDKNTKLIWIGRFTEVKRPDLAIKFFKDYRKKYASTDAYLYMLGDGHLFHEIKNSLTNEIEQNKIEQNIYFEGFKENISPYLNSSSILLLTSDNEGIPTVVLEAMHAKIPIISRDLGGIKEILSKVPEYPIEIIPEDNLDKAKDIINNLTSNYYEFKNKAEVVDTSFFLKERLIEDYIKFIKKFKSY